MTISERSKPEEHAAVMLEGLANIAAKMGFDRARLIEDVVGDSELGRFCRALLGLQSTAVPPKKRGRPSSDDNLWQVYVFVELARREGLSVADAIRKYVKDTDGDNKAETRFANARKQYERARGKFGRLAALYL